MHLVINLVSAKLKRQSVKAVKRLVTMQKFVETITEINNDRSNNLYARFTGNKKKNTNINLVADDNEILETTPREDIL